jgi:hypothetical protein
MFGIAKREELRFFDYCKRCKQDTWLYVRRNDESEYFSIVYCMEKGHDIATYLWNRGGIIPKQPGFFKRVGIKIKNLFKRRKNIIEYI